MASRISSSPEALRRELITLLERLEDTLEYGEIREQVRLMLSARALLRTMGSSVIDSSEARSARERILAYLKANVRTPVAGDELAMVAGISERARRVRELRSELGYAIVTGRTAVEMALEDDSLKSIPGIGSVKVTDYILLESAPDTDAATRWTRANTIRRKDTSVRSRLLEYLRTYVGTPVSGEELRYVADGATEWASRVRELRTEHGWPVVTRTTGRPSLDVCVYMLESDRQLPEHDRRIPDTIRIQVLERDRFSCTDCGWGESSWHKADPRNHLELHHLTSHADGGENSAENLVVLCNVCHDQRHRSDIDAL